MKYEEILMGISGTVYVVVSTYNGLIRGVFLDAADAIERLEEIGRRGYVVATMTK